MASPANTFSTYDTVGIREDLEGMIYDISPDETPLLSAIAKVKATNTLHEWQTNALRASAVNANIEGDATALYLSNLLSSSDVKISRLARGLPIGGTLDHIDQTTLSRSIEDRVEIK